MSWRTSPTSGYPVIGVAMMQPTRIGFLGFDGITALDLVGPIEAFAAAVLEDDRGVKQRCYKPLTIGVTGLSFASESGLSFKADTTLQSAPALDTIVIPGGSGLRHPEVNATVATWLKNRAKRTRRIASVCTGIYALAPSGLLDGRRVTTHWRFVRDVAHRFPRLKVEANALFLKDGPFYTSAGITAGIDLALALMEEDCGPRVALSVARELVVYFKRPGGQEQYSEPLQFQIESTDAFSELMAWMTRHLRQDLSVDVLAGRAGLSPRHFSRRFLAAYRTSPAACVESLRLDEARRRLLSGHHPIERVAESVGFRSADAFRRAFERRFSITPSSYRQRFRTRATREPLRTERAS
jgi:transcriptional regulator GlxA family with amidase domain